MGRKRIKSEKQDKMMMELISYIKEQYRQIGEIIDKSCKDRMPTPKLQNKESEEE